MRQIINNLPPLLVSQTCWLCANQQKIPVLPNSSIPVRGDRRQHCQPLNSIRPLLIDNTHFWAVYLHSQQEPFSTIDLDNARQANGEPVHWCQSLIDYLTQKDSLGYLEISSSGNGYHILCRGKAFDNGTKITKRLYYPTGQKDKAAGKIEIISANNLITFTGDVVQSASEPLTNSSSVMDYLKKTFPNQHTTVTTAKRLYSNTELSRDEIIDALQHIDPDCHHDEWKQIGMAIHHWCNGSTAGREIWRQWSTTGQQYDSNADKMINSAWKSFKAQGITVASLIRKAKDNGYQRTGFVKPQKPEKHSCKNNSVLKKNTQLAPAYDNVTAMPNMISDGVNALVDRFNRLYVHTLMSNKNVIMRLEPHHKHPQLHWVSMPIKEFRDMLLHEDPVPIGAEVSSTGKSKLTYSKAPQVWLTSKNKNWVPGVTFYPKVTDEFPPLHDNRLNLYRGFSVDPVNCGDQDCALMLYMSHLLNIVCQKNTETFNYLLDWCAHMVQKPSEKPQAAILMKGGQGTGKNTAIRPLLAFMGVHGLYIEKSRGIAGQFNSIIENKILIFADEAVFRSREATLLLRALITEDENIIESKFANMISQKNYSRIIMATNDDTAIQFANDERRFLVLQLSDSKKQDTKYFAALKKCMDDQLPAKLLYYLQHRDISNFLPMNVPKTTYLTEEKIHNLKPEQRFIYEALINGHFILNSGWPAQINTIDMHQWFRDWLDKHRHSFAGDIAMKVGHNISKIGGWKIRQRAGQVRFYAYQFPLLDVARKKFEKNILSGSLVDWSESENPKTD